MEVVSGRGGHKFRGRPVFVYFIYAESKQRTREREREGQKIILFAFVWSQITNLQSGNNSTNAIYSLIVV